MDHTATITVRLHGSNLKTWSAICLALNDDGVTDRAFRVYVTAALHNRPGFTPGAIAQDTHGVFTMAQVRAALTDLRRVGWADRGDDGLWFLLVISPAWAMKP